MAFILRMTFIRGDLYSEMTFRTEQVWHYKKGTIEKVKREKVSEIVVSNSSSKPTFISLLMYI